MDCSLSGVFLTEQGAQEWMERQGCRLSNPKAEWRFVLDNPELALLLRVLEAYVGAEPKGRP
ncbi:MAG: hypothetical protein ABW189_06515 [Rickettsiales bacterium]